jgi:hypothetical protein
VISFNFLTTFEGYASRLVMKKKKKKKKKNGTKQPRKTAFYTVQKSATLSPFYFRQRPEFHECN